MARIRTVMCFGVQHAILWWIFQKLRGANILEDQSIWSAKHELTFEKNPKNFCIKCFSFVNVAYICYWSHIRFFFAFLFVICEEMSFPRSRTFPCSPCTLAHCFNYVSKYGNRVFLDFPPNFWHIWLFSEKASLYPIPLGIYLQKRY